MASNPCPNKVQCECLDFPIRNFTREGPEPPFIGIVHVVTIPRLNETWTAAGCIAECDSDISQEDANDCARRQAQLCANPTLRAYCSDPVVGVYVCPDGSSYFFPIPEGTFCDVNLEQANAVAQSTANNRAATNHFCLNVPCLSPCLNQFASFSIPIVGGTGPFTIELFSGAIPPGMTLVASGRTIGLSGTPTVAGAQAFTLKISDGVGGYLLPTLTVRVLLITPATLPAFTQGAAYSQQLGVVGGSGNYAWKLLSGSLPTGLTLSIGGLISGTPTSGVATAFSVQVIDLTCETLNKTFFPPRVALVGHSSHTIATIIGYPEYIASTPPKKYKKLTWLGTSEQYSISFVDESLQTSGAKYEWSGTGEINDAGQRISSYVKNFYAQCSPKPELYGADWPIIVSAFAIEFIGKQLHGYCNVNDPRSCPVCETPYPFQANVAANNIFDGSDFVFAKNIPGVTTATSFAVNGTAGLAGFGLDPATVSGIPSGTAKNEIIIRQADNYSAVLSDEYTDAIALANALTFQSNGLVAENRPRTTGFVSSFTAVQFDLQCSNLLPGESYVATAELWTSTGARVLRSYAFTALGTTHVVSDNLPTPVAQTTIQVKNPILRFA